MHQTCRVINCLRCNL